MRYASTFWRILTVAIVVCFCSEAKSNIIYVKQDAAGLNDGSTWENAFLTLDDALAAANSGDEIWVGGTSVVYDNESFPRPAIYLPGLVASSDSSFVLKAGVKMYGGFAGTETSTSERTYDQVLGKLSILAGWPISGSVTEHVLRSGTGIDGETLIDGFKIQLAGTPGTLGGGLLNEGGSPTFSNCLFEGLKGAAGAAAYSTGGSPTFINCIFTKNQTLAEPGGTILATAGAPSLINCTLYNNTAPADQIEGVVFPESGFIANSIFWNESASGNEISGSPTVSYSIVQGGFTGESNTDADPLIVVKRDLPTVANGSPAIDAGDNLAIPAFVTRDNVERPRFRSSVDADGFFPDNKRVDIGALESGGLAFVDPGAFPGGDGSSWDNAFTDLFDACVKGYLLDVREFWIVAGTYKPHSGLPADRTRSFFPRGAAMFGGFVGNETRRDQSDPVTNETILSGNIGSIGSRSDNTIQIVKGTPEIDGFTIRDGNGFEGVLGTFSGTGIAFAGNAIVRNCRFINNLGVGGAAVWIGGTGVVERCVFEGNVSSLGAGAVYLKTAGTIENSLFVNNQSDNGGAIFVEQSGQLINCTIVNNQSSGSGGGVWGSPAMINCIFWENTAVNGNQIFGTSPTINSIVQGGWPGSNLNVASPGFVAESNNFRLSASSPAVDAGAPTPSPSGLDADGNARRLDGDGDGFALIDIGAYEFGVVNRIQSVSIEPGSDRIVRFTGTPTLTYSVEASGNLADWETLGTAVFSGSDFEFTDTAASTGETRYYRTRLP